MRKLHKPATAIDVARLAGVSQSAVSRAFTPGASISEETRKKVVQAAKALNYRVNIVARSLITQKSGVIGVTMGRLDQFNPHLLEALTKALRQAGYGAMLFITDPEHDADLVLDDALQRRVDGFVLAATRLSSSFAMECRNAGIPVIFLNRTTDDKGIFSVTGDDVGGGAEIARFLLAAGHKRFAYMAGITNSSTSRDREKGFMRELRKHGIRNVLKVAGNYSFDGATRAAREMLDRRNRPDAIFCASDYMALAALEVTKHEFSLRVPDDVSIVGFGDVVAASWPSYNLTTFSLPVAPMVGAVIKILEGVTNDAAVEASRHIVDGKLIVRGSARLPPTDRQEP